MVTLAGGPEPAPPPCSLCSRPAEGEEDEPSDGPGQSYHGHENSNMAKWQDGAEPLSVNLASSSYEPPQPLGAVNRVFE